MNFYKLVYIKGISNFDTWKFSSKEEQYNYFDSLQGEQINDYYPPHYTNSIRFDKNDVDYTNSHYNYVLLYFDNKYYCYFIDDLVYINEDVYELILVKDTIQTYMFDVNFRYANVNRESIKRWNDVQNKIINRNYQRENISKEEFVNVSYEERNNDSYSIIVQCSEIGIQTQSGAFLTNYTINDVMYVSGFYYLYLPLPFGVSSVECQNFEFTIHLYDTPTHLVGTFTFTSDNIKDIITDNSVNNIFIVNSSFIDDVLVHRSMLNYNIRVNADGTKTYVEEDNYVATNKCNLAGATIGRTSIWGMYLKGIDTDFITEDFTLNVDFMPNVEINKPFNIKYIPQLLDENYYHLFYGEKNNYTTYPLFKSDKVIFSASKYYDIFTGERTYKLLPKGEIRDKYNTTINSPSREIMELLNDPWKNYQSQNSASLTIGRCLSPFKSLFGIGGDVSRNYFSTEGLKNFEKHPRKNTVEYTGELTRGLANVGQIPLSVVGDIAGNQLDYLITKSNLEHAPNTERQGNNYSSDVLNRSLKIVKSIEVVKDIENVGKLLEEFGYNVDKTYINTNIFNLNYRYYYNVVRCDNLQIDAISCMMGNTDKNDFISRFQNGLRLWNKNNNVEMYDNLQYDNVENDFIQ